MDLKEEEILGDQVHSHWYYRAKAAALLRDLSGFQPREILDIGAGSGYFSKILLQQTSAAQAFCVDIGYAQERDELWCGKPILFRRAIAESDANLVLAMDVIEHAADDIALLRPYVDLVRPGTRFIVTVPAFNFLWSGHDVFLGHHRRYALRGLERTLRRCGLVVESGHYYYGALFPVAAALRLLERLGPRSSEAPRSQLHRHGELMNAALAAVCAAERPLMRANRLFGLTAFACCHKP